MAEKEIFERINKHLDKVIIKLDEVFDDCPLVLNPVMQHLKKARGKNIRAAVIIATADALKGVNDEIISLACATELLHLSTLVHDDVIDEADMRRGITSIQKEFGKKIAVIAGDYLFTKCFKLVAENNKDRMSDFANAISTICLGEALQHQNNKNLNLTKHQYYKIITGKTAAMFAMAMYGAATECKANKLIANRLGRAGYYMGMVFQIVDDCLDYDGSEQNIKKNLYKDLEQGIITYPLIHTLKAKPELKELLYRQHMSYEIMNKIVAEVKESGGLEAAKKEALEKYERAKTKINNSLPKRKSATILDLLDFIYYRNH